MSSIIAVRRCCRALAWAFALLACPCANAAAQAPDPNPGALTISGALDSTNAYVFRGIVQENKGLIVQPAFDLGIALHTGDGAIRSFGVNVGTWNSLHRGFSGSTGPSGKLWYESDFYATLGVGFGGGVSLGTTYTAYTSPNNRFSTVKEIAVKAAVDDHTLGVGIRPYALVAFELDTTPFHGQADIGLEKGTYIELGVAPRIGSKVTLVVPLKVGLSGGNYYENAGADDTFGYFSAAGVVTVPLGGTGRYGAWNVHGAAEWQQYGGTLKQLNEGYGVTDGRQIIVSGGIGFTY